MADTYLFFSVLDRLKDTLRRGWYIRGVPEPESVPDHMYAMAVMCLVTPEHDEHVRAAATLLAIAHDMGESLVGDITPSDGISEQEKYQREEMAFEFFGCVLSAANPSFAKQLLLWWRDFERGETSPSMIARQYDELECIVQAVIYLKRTGIKRMSEFMTPQEDITLPELKPLLAASLQEYDALGDGQSSDRDPVLAYLFRVFELIESLKTTKLPDWVDNGVPNPESVATHMYFMAVWCLAIPGIDYETRIEALYMALVHNIGGDVIEKIKSIDHRRAERLSEPLRNLESGRSPAAILARQIHRLELIRQAVRYEERAGKDLGGLVTQNRDGITLPELMPFRDACLVEYEQLKARKQADIIVIFVSGGPGVGKGTQCARVAQDFGLCHISVGDLLRQEMDEPESPFAEFIKKSIERSVITPAQLTTRLLKRTISEKQAGGTRKFLLDGFPRSVDQAIDFELKICKRYSTLSFTCQEEELQRRLESRSKSSGRIDDNPETIRRRIATFNEANAPVLRYLENNSSVYPIECDGSIDDAYHWVREAVRYAVNV